MNWVQIMFQVPNPLFDLAGIMCGQFGIPFWEFFLSTLLGKAIIKTHIQVCDVFSTCFAYKKSLSWFTAFCFYWIKLFLAIPRFFLLVMALAKISQLKWFMWNWLLPDKDNSNFILSWCCLIPYSYFSSERLWAYYKLSIWFIFCRRFLLFVSAIINSWTG